MSTRVAYLGPKGTYAEKAAKALAALEKLDSPEFSPCKGLRSVVDNLANNLCEAAVVPIEKFSRRWGYNNIRFTMETQKSIYSQSLSTTYQTLINE